MSSQYRRQSEADSDELVWKDIDSDKSGPSNHDQESLNSMRGQDPREDSGASSDVGDQDQENRPPATQQDSEQAGIGQEQNHYQDSNVNANHQERSHASQGRVGASLVEGPHEDTDESDGDSDLTHAKSSPKKRTVLTRVREMLVGQERKTEERIERFDEELDKAANELRQELGSRIEYEARARRDIGAKISQDLQSHSHELRKLKQYSLLVIGVLVLSQFLFWIPSLASLLTESLEARNVSEPTEKSVSFRVEAHFWRKFKTVAVTSKYIADSPKDKGRIEWPKDKLTLKTSKTDTLGENPSLFVQSNDYLFEFPLFQVKDGQYSVADFENWELQEAMVMSREGKDGNVDTNLLRSNDQLAIYGKGRVKLATVHARADLQRLRFPYSKSVPANYAVVRQSSGVAYELDVVFDPFTEELTLINNPSSSAMDSIVLINELTGRQVNRKSGQVLSVFDLATKELAGYQFHSSDKYQVFPTSFTARPKLSTNALPELRYRPREVRFQLKVTDQAFPIDLDQVEVTTRSKHVQFLQTDAGARILLPSKEVAQHLDDVELTFASPGYRSATKPLDEVAKGIQEGNYELSLERTHSNIVFVWPATRGMADELEPQSIQRGESLLRNILPVLRDSLVGQFGYSSFSTQLFTGALEDLPQNLSSIAYVSADKPRSLIQYSLKGGTNIYQDGAPELMGHHTIVIVCFPAGVSFPQNIEQLERFNRVFHVHGIGVSKDKADLPFVKSFLEKGCDSYSLLELSKEEEFAKQANQLAKEIQAEINKRYQSDSIEKNSAKGS